MLSEDAVPDVETAKGKRLGGLTRELERTCTPSPCTWAGDHGEHSPAHHGCSIRSASWEGRAPGTWKTTGREGTDEASWRERQRERARAQQKENPRAPLLQRERRRARATSGLAGSEVQVPLSQSLSGPQQPPLLRWERGVPRPALTSGCSAKPVMTL